MHHKSSSLTLGVVKKILVRFQQGLTHELEGPVLREPHVHLQKTKKSSKQGAWFYREQEKSAGVLDAAGICTHLTVDVVGGPQTAGI